MNSLNNDLLEKFISKYGSDELEKYMISKLSSKEEKVLTIIGNEGIHPIPTEYLHGEVFVASSGSLDLSTKESVIREYNEILLKVIKKLQEENWEKVYFILTGHTTLVVQIKLLVYHILRISTIDLFYSKGTYFELEFDYRELLKSKKSGDSHPLTLK